MKLSNALSYCVIFFLCLNNAVFRTFSLPRNVTVGLIQRRNVHTPWTDKTMLENALKQQTFNNITNEPAHFNFEYLNEANFSSVLECLRFLCGSLAPSNLYALVTTYNSSDTQVLTQWSALAGIHVLGASRSSAFQNQVKSISISYFNYK